MARPNDVPPQADEAAQPPEAETQPAASVAEVEATSAPPPTSLMLSMPSKGIVVRMVTLICLIISVSVLASNSTTITIKPDQYSFLAPNATDNSFFDYNDVYSYTFHFNDVYAYRYVLSTAVIGLSYTFLILMLSIDGVKLALNFPLKDPGIPLYKFIGDKVICALLATGVGAAFGSTVDLKSNVDQIKTAFELFLDNTAFSTIFSKLDDFFNRAYIPTIFLLIAFITSGISSFLSSLALTRANNT